MDRTAVIAYIKKYSIGYRRRIILSMIVFLIAVFVPLVIYGIMTDRNILQRNVDNNGRYLVNNLALNSETGAFSENISYLKTPLTAILQDPDALWAAVYNSHGELLYSQKKAYGCSLSLPDDIKALISGWPNKELQKHIIKTGESEIAEFYAPIYLRSGQAIAEADDAVNPAKSGELIGVARVGMSLDSLAQRTGDILTTALLLAVVYMVLGFIAILFVARSITRPVRELSRGAQEIGRGKMETRIGFNTRDEIGALARAFNDMADQLQRQMHERIRAEEEMARLMAAVEQAIETVIIIGLDGIIIYANPAVEHTTGYAIDEIVGKKFKDINYNEPLYDEVWGIISAGTVWSGKVTGQKKDAAMCDFEVTITPIRSKQGDIINFVSIGRDITKELKIEEQLRQAQKMESIGTLAGGIAHDFNNILGAIMGYTEMSLVAAPQGSNLKHNLEQILKSSMRARDLVKQILAFSRKSMHERKPVQISLIVKEALKLLRASIPTTVEIRQNISEGAACIVNADSTQMHQVIMNLCTNAAQAMSERGGVLEIELRPVVLDEHDVLQYPEVHQGRHLKLTVRDTGTGIHPKIMGRIFDPFFTTKEVGKGTGMGLAVVHGIVKSHAGAIRAYSEPGRGTTFHIVLPLAEEKIKQEHAQESSVPFGDECILFVDDEKPLIDAGTRIFESLGYTVISRGSSLEALEVFRIDPTGFDIIITDQTMPQMTGYELAKKALEIRPDIPIILCTGYSEQVSAERAKELGIRAFVLKPINRREIAETIRKTLDKQ